MQNSLSHKIYKWLAIAIINFGLILILFFCITNTLFSFPLDKLMITLLLLIIALIQANAPLMSSKEFSVIVSCIVIALISSLVNLTVAPMIYFPVIGFAFALIIKRYPLLLLHSLYYALFVNIVFGLIFDGLALAGIENPFVSHLIKGISFLYSPRGFTATVQTYGTLCITWLLLYQLRKQAGINNYLDKLFFVINTIAIIASLNRSTLLFWMLILFFKYRKLFFSIVCVLFIVMIRLWREIISFIANASTLTSRSQLLQGFNISFVQSHSLLVYLFGKGTNQLPPDVVRQVRWYDRSDIENGYAMLLHSYGSLGLLVYVLLCFSFIFKFVKIKRWAEAIILFYFFFITQYFTQEFVSVTFYFFLAVMLLTYNLYSGELKLASKEPEYYNISFS